MSKIPLTKLSGINSFGLNDEAMGGGVYTSVVELSRDYFSVFYSVFDLAYETGMEPVATPAQQSLARPRYMMVPYDDRDMAVSWDNRDMRL